MRLKAFHIRFDRGMLEDVVHHKGREFLHPDESHRFVERHKEPVKAPAFKELLRILKGFKRRVYRLDSYPGDDGYATFGSTVPTPKMATA